MIRTAPLFFIALIFLHSLPALSVEVGYVAPNITGRWLDNGRLFSLKKQLTGENKGAKVINFFWVECVPCRQELPHLAKLEKAYPKVRFFGVHSGVNTDTHQNYTLEQVQGFVSSLEAAPKQLVWAGPQVMKKKWKLAAYPSTVVLDEQHQVIATLLGYTPKAVARLENLLKQLSK